MKYDRARIIGRFQLPHKPHFQLIKDALQIAPVVDIGLGSANIRRNLRNPFSVEQRMALLGNGDYEVSKAIRDGRINFVPLEDSYYSDQWWIEHVQRQFAATAKATSSKVLSESNVALVGCDKDSSTYYLKMFPQWEYVEVEQKAAFGATDARNSYYAHGIDNALAIDDLKKFTTEETIDALRTVIPRQVWIDLHDRYTFCVQYKKEWGEGPHYTADAVVIKSGHVLLIQRGQQPDIGSWAFPGGFRNKDGHLLELSLSAALRELKEETGFELDATSTQSLIRSPIRGDYEKANRDDRGDIRTTAYLFDLGYGELPEVKGGDDAAHAQWVPIADLNAANMFSDHYFIFRDLIRKL